MKLDGLPVDVLTYLPEHLLSIYDFYSLFSTCRLFYEQYGIPHAHPYALPPLTPSHIMQPYPHLLIAGTARQIGDWAGRSKHNDDELYDCLARGNEGLLELAGRVASLTLLQIRELHRLKRSLVNPLCDILSAEIQAQARAVPVASPVHVIMNHWIYDELFHAFPDQILGNPYTDTLELRTRYRWIAMCMPDPTNKRNPTRWAPSGTRAELTSTPYEQMDLRLCHMHSYALTRRKRITVRYFEHGVLEEAQPSYVLIPSDGDTLDGMRSDLCRDIAMSLGAQSLFYTLPGYITSNHAVVKSQLQRIRDAVALLNDADILQNSRRLSRLPTPVGNDWRGWHGLLQDTYEGTRTVHWSREQREEDEEKLNDLRFKGTKYMP